MQCNQDSAYCPGKWTAANCKLDVFNELKFSSSDLTSAVSSSPTRPLNRTLTMQHKMRTMLKEHTVTCATKEDQRKMAGEITEAEASRSVWVFLESSTRFLFKLLPRVSSAIGKQSKCFLSCILEHHQLPAMLLRLPEVVQKKDCELIETIKHGRCRTHCAQCLLLDVLFNSFDEVHFQKITIFGTIERKPRFSLNLSLYR